MGNFYVNVICKDHRYACLAPVADLALLEPSFRARAQAMVADARTQGVTLQVLETYRSRQRQTMLYFKRASKLKTVGVHHFGLACDFGVVTNGVVNWHADYAVIGRLAARHGVVWGGDWGNPAARHSFPDFGHIQGVPVARQKLLFAGQWYPPAGYQAMAELAA